MKRIIVLLATASYIIRNDGFGAFTRRGIAFLRYQLFFHRSYYLHVTRLAVTNRTAEEPQIQDFSFKIITSNQQVKELTAEGFEFRPWYPVYSQRLDKGATAFCGFDSKQLVHTSWCSFTGKAWKTLGEPPFKVDFSDNEAATGDYWTDSAYRGKGLAHYATVQREHYIRANGRTLVRGSIARDNQRAQRVSRFGTQHRYAEGRYLKILCWKSWRETPIVSQEEPVPSPNRLPQT